MKDFRLFLSKVKDFYKDSENKDLDTTLEMMDNLHEEFEKLIFQRIQKNFSFKINKCSGVLYIEFDVFYKNKKIGTWTFDR